MASIRAPLRVLFPLLLMTGLSACTAVAVTTAVVGAAASVAVEVVEVPFEVAGGVVDVMSDDDDHDNEAGEDEDG